MSINVTVKNHTRLLPENFHNAIKRVIQESGLDKEVNVYSTDMSKSRQRRNQVVIEQKLLVMLYATPFERVELQRHGAVTINNNVYRLTSEESAQPAPTMTPTIDMPEWIQEYKDDNGVTYAQYDTEMRALYIPLPFYYNRFVNLEAAEGIMKEAMARVIEFEANRDRMFSWTETDNKEPLIKRIRERMADSVRRERNELESTILNYETQATELRRKLKSAHDNAMTSRIRLAALGADDAIEKKIISELDVIAGNPKFKRIVVEADGRLTITTAPIQTYASNGDKFQLGEITMKINMQNTDIRFSSPLTHRSYWSDRDPHPHVNGRDGSACLGNVGPTIAELCSKNEIYALALVLVDFLENANLDDPAGRHVYNWDQIDEEGNVIHEGAGNRNLRDSDDLSMLRRNREQGNSGGGGSSRRCEHCGERAGSTRTVYTRYDGGGDVGRDQQWCETCTDHHATYNEHIDEYCEDEVSENVDEYFE